MDVAAVLGIVLVALRRCAVTSWASGGVAFYQRSGSSDMDERRAFEAIALVVLDRAALAWTEGDVAALAAALGKYT